MAERAGHTDEPLVALYQRLAELYAAVKKTCSPLEKGHVIPAATDEDDAAGDDDLDP